MKKIAVLVIALALVSMAAFASDVSFAGEFTYGGIANADGNAEAWGNAYLDTTFKVDDINTVLLEVSNDPGVAWSVGVFRLTTDLGKALKLDAMGLGLKAYTGWFGSNNKDYAEVGGYNNQDVTDSVGVTAHGGMMFDLGIKNLVNLVYGQAFNASSGQVKFGAYTVMGPVSAAVWYALDGNAPADADIAAELKVTLGKMLGDKIGLDIGASFVDNLGTSAYKWGAGVHAGFGMFSANVGVNGNDVDFLDGVGIAVNVAPLANVGIDAGVFLDTFDGAAETMNSLDISAYYKAGAATFRAGYLYTALTVAANIVALNAPTGLADGGIYASFDIDF